MSFCVQENFEVNPEELYDCVRQLHTDFFNFIVVIQNNTPYKPNDIKAVCKRLATDYWYCYNPRDMKKLVYLGFARSKDATAVKLSLCNINMRKILVTEVPAFVERKRKIKRDRKRYFNRKNIERMLPYYKSDVVDYLLHNKKLIDLQLLLWAYQDRQREGTIIVDKRVLVKLPQLKSAYKRKIKKLQKVK